MNRVLTILLVVGLIVAGGAASLADSETLMTQSSGVECDRPPNCRIDLGGPVGQYVHAVTANWLLVAPDSNPEMLGMFRDRDRKPYQTLMLWSGEFAGKYLTAAVQVYRINRDPALRSYLQSFVNQLVMYQAPDGYLGPFPTQYELTGKTWNGITWDTWGHYHVMMGLMFWYDETKDKNALNCAGRIGDLLCAKFLNAEPGHRIVDIGWPETNLAPIHSLCLLYERTGKSKYLELAKEIAEEFAAQGENGPLAGDYIRTALAGKEFFQTPKPRWESLHPIMGIIELYKIIGDVKYRQAFENIWWSIVKLDRHNNGGFSTGEGAVGNSYKPGPIETCCNIAWSAMTVDMLKVTGNSVVADELELTLINSIIGLHSPTGRWVTYNTPMDGVRKSSVPDAGMQRHEGSPELSCCSVNGARGFGLISEWAVMKTDNGIFLNYYGPSAMKLNLASGNALAIKQDTNYPADGSILIRVSPSKPERFALMLRIPSWSRATVVKVNDVPVTDVTPGTYLKLDRKWKAGDKIELTMDMSLHYWAGERECDGLTSIYRGPILLTYDRYFNDMDPDNIPALDTSKMAFVPVSAGVGKRQPIVLLEFTASDGRKLRLCDFGSAGYAGTPYKSWLKVNNVRKTEFSRSNPLRS